MKGMRRIQLVEQISECDTLYKSKNNWKYEGKLAYRPTLHHLLILFWAIC